MAGPFPPEPQRELWQPPAGWAAPTKPVASWYDKGERLTPAVKSWFDAGLRLKPTGWGLRSEQLAEAAASASQVPAPEEGESAPEESEPAPEGGEEGGVELVGKTVPTGRKRDFLKRIVKGLVGQRN